MLSFRGWEQNYEQAEDCLLLNDHYFPFLLLIKHLEILGIEK